MAKDNMQNAQLERVAREVPPLCILGTLSSSEGEYSSEYADPDISGLALPNSTFSLCVSGVLNELVSSFDIFQVTEEESSSRHPQKTF